MKTTINKTTSIIMKGAVSATAIALLATSAHAERGGAIAEWPELRNCVSALDQRIDLDDAMRVRHEVSSVEDARVGVALTIRTSVFREGGESRYSTHCIASGNFAPMRLRVEETVD